jgi:hypothetical protein
MRNYYTPESPFSVLKGLTLAEVRGAKKGSGQIEFITNDGRTFEMCHDQDCCESVGVVDVVGDIAALVGYNLTEVEAVENPQDAPDLGDRESYTWTFYKLGTVKGRVTLRWLGESNGYYGESVQFYETTPKA